MQTAINFEPMRLPPETAVLRTQVRAFLADEAARGTFDPNAGLKNPGYDRDFSMRVGAQGWIGMTWPRQYGGAERSHLDRYVVTEEFRAASAPTWSHFVADRQSGPVILKYGSEAMKADILSRITRGEVCFAIGMSEPNSGSDLFAATTRAELEGDSYRVNGTKIWTSNAHRAEYMIALLRTS
ncbi:MAG TPA: acyl-CoA dehydrogenase family protein, partial [Devosiaceae bacterium]|nr:acyl-CoA dehydrogenase family protein [Devosiaceae bacterium]